MPADQKGTVLTIDELAECLKISKSTLYKLAQEGKIPGPTDQRAHRPTD